MKVELGATMKGEPEPSKVTLTLSPIGAKGSVQFSTPVLYTLTVYVKDEDAIVLQGVSGRVVIQNEGASSVMFQTRELKPGYVLVTSVDISGLKFNAVGDFARPDGVPLTITVLAPTE